MKTSKLKMTNDDEISIVPPIEYYNEEDSSEWPDLVERYDEKTKQFQPSKMAQCDLNIEFKAKYRKLVEERGIKIKGLKKKSEMSKYLVLLAKYEIISNNLNLTSTFKNTEQIKIFCNKLQYDISIHLSNMIPVIKPEFVAGFNVFVMDRYRNSIKNKDNIDNTIKVALLDEAIWKALERSFDDPSSFYYYLGEDDMVYLHDPRNKALIIGKHRGYISDLNMLEIYQPVFANMIKDIKQTSTDFKNLMNLLPDKKTPREKEQNNNSKKKARSKVNEDKQKLVNEFIDDLYVIDENAYISTSEIYNKYVSWLEDKQYDDDHCRIANSSRMGIILTELNIPKIRQQGNNGYTLKLANCQ